MYMSVYLHEPIVFRVLFRSFSILIRQAMKFMIPFRVPILIRQRLFEAPAEKGHNSATKISKPQDPICTYIYIYTYIYMYSMYICT